MRDSPPFQPNREHIVVPHSVVDGLLTALHIRFSHPSKYQLKCLFTRYFFALDVDRALKTVWDSCHHCQSLKTIPKQLRPQSTSEFPTSVGISFAADVMRRYRQCIFILQETVSSYTIASIIESERQEHLRDALLILCSELKSLRDGGVTIRVDPAPGFSSLVNNKILASSGILFKVGRSKNPNKNPVAERAIAELGMELLKLQSKGGPVTPVLLAQAVANMNSRIRRAGLSAHEIWTQRDQMTGKPLPIIDRDVLSQNVACKKNHQPSAKSKASGKLPSPTPPITIGDLVFLKGDKDKTKAREKYLIIAINNSNMCHLGKFTSSQFRSKVYVVPITHCYLI